jgi:hypothetical protein
MQKAETQPLHFERAIPAQEARVDMPEERPVHAGGAV